jgi:predicted metal-dependent hydrolase
MKIDTKARQDAIDAGGISVDVVRRRRQKTIRVSVRAATGDVRVSAPLWLPNSEIERFVESKQAWIKKHVARAKQRSLETPEPNFASGELHSLWGRQYRLAVFESGEGGEAGATEEAWASIAAEGAGEAGAADGMPGESPITFRTRVRDGGAAAEITIRIRDGVIIMHARAPSQSKAPGATRKMREAAMRAWHGHELLAAAKPLAARWERALGVRVNEVRARHMSTRWGSCSGAPKRVWLSTRLAKKPPACLEYVVLHELAHLLVMNHGSGFVAIMDRHMPDWRERRAALNGKR